MKPLILAALLAFRPAEDPAALSERAAALASEQRFTEAADLWRKALDASPGFFPALFNLGYMYFTQGEPETALPFLERAAQAEPGDFNTRYLLGAILVQLGRPEDGLRQWRRAIEINPRHVKLMGIMIVEYNKGRYYKEAAALAERALDLERGDPNLYYLAIKACQDDNTHDAARSVAALLAKRFPELARANAEYAFTLHKAGLVDEALPYLEKAIKGDPSHEEPFFYYGEILHLKKRHEEALPYLRKAVELRPDYMTAWTTLGRALMALGRYEEAAAEMEKAAKIDPDHPQPQLLLSQIYFRLGNEEGARRAKELSLRFRRENPTAMEAPLGRDFPAAPPDGSP